MRDIARSAPDRASQPRRATTARTPADPMLELQRTVGNRAARAVLAREPAPADTKRATSISIEGLGTVDVLSYSFGGGTSSGATGAGRAEPSRHNDVLLTSKMGDLTPKIAQAITSGKHFDSAVLSNESFIVTLSDVIVSSYSTGSGDVEQWTLNYGSIDYKYARGE